MNCPTCERNLSAYIDDELTTDVRLEIEAHLDECATCRREFEAHQAAWEAVGLAPAGQAPEELWQAVETELQPQEEGGATTLEDLALMLRGMAGEMQDLRRTVDGLRREIEAGEWPQEREADEDIRVPSRTFAAGRQRPGSIEQKFRRSS